MEEQRDRRLAEPLHIVTTSTSKPVVFERYTGPPVEPTSRPTADDTSLGFTFETRAVTPSPTELPPSSSDRDILVDTVLMTLVSLVAARKFDDVSMVNYYYLRDCTTRSRIMLLTALKRRRYLSEDTNKAKQRMQIKNERMPCHQNLSTAYLPTPTKLNQGRKGRQFYCDDSQQHESKCH